VELAVFNGAPADLQGWWLSDRVLDPERRFVVEGLIPEAGWLVVDVTDAPFDPCNGHLFLGRPDGAVVDELGDPAPAVGTWGRLPDASGPWLSTAPTPGAANAARVPGRVVLNEVDCQGRDWIELFNPGEVPTHLNGWTVTDRVEDPERSYALSGVVAPGAWTSVRRAENGGLGFSFGIGCGDEHITLINPAGEVADTVEVPALLDDHTWSRLPDGHGAWQPGEPTRAAANQLPVDQAAWLFEPATVHTVALTVDELGIERLRRDPRQPVDVQVLFDDEPLRPAGIRIKGRLGSLRTLDQKPGFKLDFEFGGGGRFYGVEKLALNNMVQDRSKIHEFSAYALFRAMGVAAPRTSYAQITLNGADYGLYAIIEVLDGPALDRWFVSTDHLYEGAYGQDLVVDRLDDLDRDGGDNDRGQLYRLVAVLDDVPESAGFEATLALIDWPQVVAMMATEIWIGHWDGYAPTRNNYNLHFDADDVLRMMPWGTDQTFDRHIDFYSGRGRLMGVCMADSDCRLLFDEALVEASLLVFELDLAQRITDLAALLRPLVELDPRLEHDLGAMDNTVARTLRFLDERHERLAPLIDCITAENRDQDGDGADCLVDCDDDDASRFPGAMDVCGDDIDQDCNGWADDDRSCPDCVPVVRGAHRYLICPTPRTYAEAEARCAEEGSAMVRLDTTEEGRWLHGQAQAVRRQQHWLGLTDQAEEGAFVWVDGAPIGDAHWQADQPNGGEADNCVAQIEDSDGPWNDRACDLRLGTLCEDPCDPAEDPDGDGVPVCAGDCAPEDPTAFPGAVEICGNAIDEDCDGEVDDLDVCPGCVPVQVGARTYRICRAPRTWQGALDDCATFGEDLTSFEQVEEYTRVMTAANAQGHGRVWVGLGDHLEEGTFVWNSGATLDYGRWRPNEPNDWGPGEDCTEARPNGWNDLVCDYTLPFICEPACAPGTDLDEDGVDGCGADCDDDDPAIGVECP
jgi:hypothetical protein